MRVQVGTIDQPSVNGMRVSSAIVFERRFPKIGGEGAVGYPSGSLLKLNKAIGTFSISFSFSF